jgi:transcriptional regulator with XRE-family HTH domain
MSASERCNERIAQAVLQRDLGLRIVELRKGRGWSRAELAKRLGVDRSRLGKWEQGRNAPSLEDLTALTAILGATLDELVFGQGTQPSPLPALQREQLLRLLAGLARVLGPLTGRPATQQKKNKGFTPAPRPAPVSTTQGGQR